MNGRGRIVPRSLLDARVFGVSSSSGPCDDCYQGRQVVVIEPLTASIVFHLHLT